MSTHFVCCVHVDGGTFASFDIGWLEGRRTLPHSYQVRWQTQELASPSLPATRGVSVISGAPHSTVVVGLRPDDELVGLESTLAIMQGLAAATSPIHLLLLTTSTQPVHQRMQPRQSEWWGLARSARQEAPQLRVTCVDIADGAQQLLTPPENEVEMAFARNGSVRTANVPRLTSSREAAYGKIHLSFHKRGALSNLTVVAQPAFDAPCGESQAELCVHAVGLNFRDVLNVLGEAYRSPSR